MVNLGSLVVLIFAVLTLLGEGFLQLFKAVFWERSFDHVLGGLPVSIPWSFAMALAGAFVLAPRVWYLAKVSRSLKKSDGQAFVDITKVFQVFGTLPRFFLVANSLIFVLGSAVLPYLLVLAGLPAPSAGDLTISVIVGLGTGGMGVLQGIAMTDGVLVRFRERLGITAVPDLNGDLSLQTRIQWTLLGAVFLGGSLALVAALGLYRELAVYLTHLSPDVLASPTISGPGALENRELFVAAEMACLLALIVVWVFFLIFVVVQNLRRQLRRLTAKVEELSSGSADLTLRVPVVFFDEIGLLTTHINGFLEKLQPLVSEVRDDAAEVAHSANKVRTEAETARTTTNDLAQLQHLVQSAVEDQVGSIHGAEVLLSQVSKATDTVTSQVQTQVVLVDQASEAIGLMAGNIASVAELTTQANNVGLLLAAITGQGQSTMEKMVASMVEIETASRSVTSLVGAISKIAAQTNLLAMNAAIEAAHAGHAGMGFAVVADEVRSLAETSAKNAREIRNHNMEMDAKIQSGTRMAQEAGGAFAEIARKIEETSGLLRTIVQAMVEQQTGANQVVETTEGMVSATQSIRLMTETQRAQVAQTSAAMAEIIQATRMIEQSVTSQTLEANQLAQTMARFTVEAGGTSAAADRLQKLVKGFKV